MKKYYDVIIVGGGVIGSSIAFYLSEQSKKVLLLEKNKLASKASSAAAGMIGAQSELEKNGSLFQLARKSREMFPNLAQKLKERSGIDIEFVTNGILKIAETDEDVSNLQLTISSQRKYGQEADWISQAEVNSLEPSLSKHIKGAMYIPNDGNVSAYSFSKALAVSAIELGTNVLEHTEVYDFIKEKHKVIGVKTMVGSFYATETIVAGGAWSEQLVNKMGVKLKTYPVKGECFSVRTKVNLIKRTIFSKNCYIVPKPGSRLLIGATERAHTFDESVSLQGISKLMNLAINFIPELKDATWEKAWAGIRPQTSDGLPYLGIHPLFQGLSSATGHYRNGILLAPITGLLMTELIDGKNIESIFKVGRNQLKTCGTMSSSK